MEITKALLGLLRFGSINTGAAVVLFFYFNLNPKNLFVIHVAYLPRA